MAEIEVKSVGGFALRPAQLRIYQCIRKLAPHPGCKLVVYGGESGTHQDELGSLPWVRYFHSADRISFGNSAVGVLIVTGIVRHQDKDKIKRVANGCELPVFELETTQSARDLLRALDNTRSEWQRVEAPGSIHDHTELGPLAKALDRFVDLETELEALREQTARQVSVFENRLAELEGRPPIGDVVRDILKSAQIILSTGNEFAPTTSMTLTTKFQPPGNPVECVDPETGSLASHQILTLKNLQGWNARELGQAAGGATAQAAGNWIKSKENGGSRPHRRFMQNLIIHWNRLPSPESRG